MFVSITIINYEPILQLNCQLPELQAAEWHVLTHPQREGLIWSTSLCLVPVAYLSQESSGLGLSARAQCLLLLLDSYKLLTLPNHPPWAWEQA